MAISKEDIAGFMELLLKDAVDTGRLSQEFNIVSLEDFDIPPNKVSDLYGLYLAWSYRIKAELAYRLTQHLARTQRHRGAISSLERISAGLDKVEEIYKELSREVKARYPELSDLVKQVFDKPLFPK